MNLTHRLLLPLFAGAAVLLGACGKSNAPVAATTASVATDGVRTIELTANDAMKFNVTEIRAQPGEKLRVSLTNLGHMPRQAMAHNWVLLRSMDDAAVLSFASAAASKMPDYLPDDRTAVLAHTKFLGGGETDTIEFSAPAQPGEYPYLCSFPGHAALMRGKLIVGPAKT